VDVQVVKVYSRLTGDLLELLLERPSYTTGQIFKISPKLIDLTVRHVR